MIQLFSALKPKRSASRISSAIDSSLDALEPRRMFVGFVPTYTLVDLGTFGGPNSFSYGVNIKGEATGSSILPGSTGRSHAFRSKAHAKISLATDDIGSTYSDRSSEGLAINDKGQVVGFLMQDDGKMAFRTSPYRSLNRYSKLGTFGGRQSEAAGVNYYGVAVGWAQDGRGRIRAFRTAPNKLINASTDNLGTLGGSESRATSVNKKGVTVGWAYTKSGAIKAFRVPYGRAIDRYTDDLGSLGGNWSKATSINDAGYVVGFALMPDRATYHAFIAGPTGKIDPTTGDLGSFGTKNSFANDINNSNVVVGNYYAHGESGRAFVRHGSTLYDLNTRISAPTRFTAENAISINDNGVIVGVGSFSNVAGSENNSRSFMAIPNEESDPTAAIASTPNTYPIGSSQYRFTITYTDNNQLDYTTFTHGDVIVTGPGNFRQEAKIVSISSKSNGSPRTVTYAFTPPGGTWSKADRGLYRIEMAANQVKDTEGNYVNPGILGYFTAYPTAASSVPQALASAFATTGSVNAEVLGLSDSEVFSG